jgi:putative ABC transport system ATP-binding protein
MSRDVVKPSVLRQAVRAQRRTVVPGAALFALHQALEVAVPVVIGVIIDRAVATGDVASITRWTLGLVALFACLSAAGCLGLYVEERAVTGAGHWARTRVAARVLAPEGGAENAMAGQVVSLSTVETGRIGEGVGAVILGVGAVTGLVVGSTVLLATSLPIGLAVVLGVPVVMGVAQLLSAPLVARADAHQAAVGTAAGVAADLLRGLRVLKGLGATRAAASTYRRASGTALGAALAATRARSAYTGLTFAVAGSFLVVVAWMGGRQALDGDLTIGQLVAALGLTQFLLGPLGRLALTGEVLAQARASSARIGAALDAAPAVTGGGGTGVGTARVGLGGSRTGADTAADTLEVRGLRHGPLDGLDLDIAAGEILGIATTAPADAAALVACLDRSTDPAGGTILLDGADHTQLDLTYARRAVTVAHHDAPLFEDELTAEVASATAEPELVAPAITAAAADEVATALAEAGDRDLGESGRGLSGGQRQRVALARALATDAPVLVLHEPTTAIDAATEHHVAAGIRSLRRGRTTVLITTSPTLLAAADRVVLVDGGRVVAAGDHAALAHDTRYHEAVLT